MNGIRGHTRFLSWIFLPMWMAAAGCGKSDSTQSEATKAEDGEMPPEKTPAQPAASTVDAKPALKAPPPVAELSPPVPPGADPKLLATLPDFATHLVFAASENGVSLETIGELNGLCAELKEQVSVPDINKLLECHLRFGEAVSAVETRAGSAVSFRLQDGDLTGESLSGESFRVVDWARLSPPRAGLAVIDFKSPRGKFEKFRVVAIPPGASNRPLTLPLSFLRANQTGIPASAEPLLAERLARLEPHGGFLQLRPFLRTPTNSVDLVDALPPAGKAAAAEGNELNFESIRSQLEDDATRQTANIEEEKQEIIRLRKQVAGLTRDAQTYAAMNDLQKRYGAQQAEEGRRDFERSTAQLAGAYKKQAICTALLGGDRALLNLVPERIEDPRLDHVSLYFVAGNPVKPGARLELIKFEGPPRPAEEAK